MSLTDNTYRCETWSVIFSEEHRLWVLENRVLSKIFGPKKDKVTEDWSRLHNEELNDLYSLSNNVKSKSMAWAG